MAACFSAGVMGVPSGLTPDRISFMADCMERRMPDAVEAASWAPDPGSRG